MFCSTSGFHEAGRARAELEDVPDKYNFIILGGSWLKE